MDSWPQKFLLNSSLKSGFIFIEDVQGLEIHTDRINTRL